MARDQGFYRDHRKFKPRYLVALESFAKGLAACGYGDEPATKVDFAQAREHFEQAQNIMRDSEHDQKSKWLALIHEWLTWLLHPEVTPPKESIHSNWKRGIMTINVALSMPHNTPEEIVEKRKTLELAKKRFAKSTHPEAPEKVALVEAMIARLAG